MNALVMPPDSIHEFTRRMVRCNVQRSLEPLGSEVLAQDQSIQKFALVVLRDWLPRFQDKGDQKRVEQLCGQIKKFFGDEAIQDKVNAVLSQITITCSSARSEHRAPWMEQSIQEVGLDSPPQERFDALMKELLWNRSTEGQIEFCQWLMSVLLFESDKMHLHLKLHVLQNETESQRKESLDENTEFCGSNGGMLLSYEFPSDQVKNFDEVCFCLSFKQMEKGVGVIQRLIAEAIRSQDRVELLSCIQRIHQEMERIRGAVGAISEFNETLKQIGEKFLKIMEGKLFELAIGCLKQSKINQPIQCAQAPKAFDATGLIKKGGQLLYMFGEKKLSSNEMVNIYFANFKAAKELYECARAKRDSLLGKRSAVPYNLSRIRNTELSTMPTSLELGPWISQQDRAILIRDVLLEPYTRIAAPDEPVQPKVAAVPRKQKKKSAKNPIPSPLSQKPLTTEEKMRLDEEEIDLQALTEDKEKSRPNVWRKLPAGPVISERAPALPVQFKYDYRVERWFADELNPADFPEYDGNPTQKDISFHAFPIEVDDYLGEALKQPWENTTTGNLDDQYVIPAEIELPDSAPVRGVICYTVGKDGICYHRYFHPMEPSKMVKKFGMRRFEKVDFPELADGNALPSRGMKPKKGKVVKEIPALGIVTFFDERSKAIVRIFRG